MSLKNKTYLRLTDIIGEKVNALQLELTEISDSISNETKSSAGDKYETSRAMLQIESDQLNKQMSNALDQKMLLGSIDINLNNRIISLGSFIKTNQGNFFLSVGLGKIDVDGTSVIALSVISPLGQKLIGLKPKDEFLFNRLNYIIESVE